MVQFQGGMLAGVLINVNFFYFHFAANPGQILGSRFSTLSYYRSAANKVSFSPPALGGHNSILKP